MKVNSFILEIDRFYFGFYIFMIWIYYDENKVKRYDNIYIYWIKNFNWGKEKKNKCL